MASFREINYSLRPAKSIERKILADGFRQLELSWPLKHYQYVGMGSIYFTDFQLFHQALGISEMVSIEREEQYKRRVEFNRPFRCISIRFGETSSILTSLLWDRRSIVWLDYDGKLEASVISDLQTVLQKARSGSVIIVSINIEPDRPPLEMTDAEAVNDWRIQEFERLVGSKFVPLGVKGNDLRGKDYGIVCYKVLTSALHDQLAKRNGRPDLRPDTMHAKQIFHFQYSDGARMLTVGWLLHSEEDGHAADRCAMKGSFFNDGANPRVISAPKLTPKEIRYLNSRLPDGPPTTMEMIGQLESVTGIGEADINKIASFYRYYPQYSEILL